MKAVIHTRYGTPDVLELAEIEKPTPQPGEALVKIHAAALNAYDWHMLTADIFLVRLMGGGLNKPKNQILAAESRGGSRRWAERKTVQAGRPGVRGHRASGGGGFAEYARAGEAASAQAGEPDLRGGGGRAHGGSPRCRGCATWGGSRPGKKY